MEHLSKVSRLLLLYLLVVCASFASAGYVSPTAVVLPSVSAENTVYICASPKAYAYHKTKTCRGLNRCAYEVKQVSQYDATAKHKRTACKLCY